MGKSSKRKKTYQRAKSSRRRPAAAAQKSDSGNRGRRRKSPLGLPWLVFFVCFIAYIINGDPLLGNDQKANMLFSVNMLKRHSLSVTPSVLPADFQWTLQRPGEETSKAVSLVQYNAEIEQMIQKGHLQPHPNYYLVPTQHPGVYVNTFGIGAAVVALPVYAALDVFSDPSRNHSLWWHGGKITASLLIACAAALVFLSLRRFISPMQAFAGALAFGIGSAACSISSQALWQQTASMFFLSLGAYFLFRSGERKSFALYCGAAFGMATLCRPTAAIITICVGLYVLFRSRSDCFRYTLGALPFAVLIGFYNFHFFGSPFVFGQIVAAERLAADKTTGGTFQTSILEGLAGSLFSPSRGVLFYSPVMLIGFAGAVMAWKNPRRFAPLIPLQVAVVLMFVLQAMWFDWWGGWTYGPRPVVDTMVFLALLAAPAIERIFNLGRMKHLFVLLLIYSIAVQFIGVWSYSILGWNDKNGMNIDKPEHRSRLWSLRDSQIAFYVANFHEQRALKQHHIKFTLSSEMPVINPRH